jgi:hypothetical protein
MMMLGLWDYSKAVPGQKYGDDDITYEKALAFMADCPTVEDWGCGFGNAKTLCKTTYRGVDGSKGPNTDVIADLREYKSETDGILLRHVLEHNHDWKKVLDNAIASFKNKMVIILFTPLVASTRQIATNWSNIPDISFRKEDILEPLKEFTVTEEVLRTKTQYGIEIMFYVTRR